MTYRSYGTAFLTVVSAENLDTERIEVDGIEWLRAAQNWFRVSDLGRHRLAASCTKLVEV